MDSHFVLYVVMSGKRVLVYSTNTNLAHYPVITKFITTQKLTKLSDLVESLSDKFGTSDTTTFSKIYDMDIYPVSEIYVHPQASAGGRTCVCIQCLGQGIVNLSECPTCSGAGIVDKSLVAKILGASN